MKVSKEHYFPVIRELPRPTAGQAERFARYVARFVANIPGNAPGQGTRHSP
jgi:hypothetical protein